MKPPICAVCRARLDDDAGGLVTFARAPEDDAFYKARERQPGFVGHPPNVEWFCRDHVERARELAERTLGEALRAFREEARG